MILIVGANGMLGREFLDLLGEKGRGVDLPEIDITREESVRKVLLTVAPRVVINCAARTDVDGCETDEAAATLVNGTGVANLAAVANEVGATLVQISTDYVFDGNKNVPYSEEDSTAPMSAYGRSKLAGEVAARKARAHLVVRTQWLYGIHGANFVETMLRLAGERDRLGVVNDQTGSPTWTSDLAKGVLALLEHGCRGTYHAVNGGSCTWYDFAREIFRQQGIEIPVDPITTAQLGRPAPRPAYSVLDTTKLSRDTGNTMPAWQEALSLYLAARRKEA